MSKIRVRVKQENINEARIAFECKPEDAMEIIQSIARVHHVEIIIDAEGMSVLSAGILLDNLKSIEHKKT